MTAATSDAGTGAAHFWPGRMRLALRPARAVPGPFVRMLRHVPCARDREAAIAAAGPAAEPMLDAWADAFAATVGDAEAIAARIGQGGGTGTGEPMPSLDDLVAMDAATAARIVAARRRDPAPKAQRDPGLHVLEDAAHFLGFARSGTDFALVGAPYSLSPLVIAGRSGEPPRLLDPSGAADEQARHAAAVRALRAILERPFPYWESPAFRRLAGRGFALADGPDHLAAILADMASQGHAKAFLKHALPKNGTWVATLSPEGGEATALAAHAAMGPAYSRIHAGSDDPARQVLVQEFLPFTHEHRFLVVDHRIVASSASDRAIGVLDAHPGRRLHPGVAALLRPASGSGAYDRGDARLVPDRGLVARMARVARDAVRAFRREGLLPPHYCLDVGLSGRGVLPIEVNTLNHCGIYAADGSRVAAALARLGPGPSAQAPETQGRTRADAVSDALDFVLDILCDGPAADLATVAAMLADLAERRDPGLARAMGLVARDRTRRDAGEPPVAPALVAAARERLCRADADG